MLKRAFDVLFAEPDRTSPALLLQDKGLNDKQRAETRDRLRYLDYEQSRLRRLLADQERMAPR